MIAATPRGEPSRSSRRFGASVLGIGILGLALCLGLEGCGSESGGHEESGASQTAAPDTAAVETDDSAPALSPGATSDVAPDPAFAKLPPVQAQPRGTGQTGHLAMTGSQDFEGDVVPNCALFPNKTFQVGMNLPGAPFFVLRIENFHGAGDYDADARVRANFSGEVIRQSRGVAKTKITVFPSAEAGGKDEISGTFSAAYKGEGGEGNVSGSFDRCRYELPKFNG